MKLKNLQSTYTYTGVENISWCIQTVYTELENEGYKNLMSTYTYTKEENKPSCLLIFGAWFHGCRLYMLTLQQKRYNNNDEWYRKDWRDKHQKDWRDKQ